MKIVSFFESIKIGGGVEKVQANLSKGLVDLGYEFIHLVLEDKEPRNDYKGKIVSLNEKFIFGFGIRKIISLFKLSYRVAKYCNKEKVDLIIGQGDFFYMIVSISKLLFGNKVKCIGVIHTTIGIWSVYIKSILIYLLKKLDKIVLTSSDEYNTFIKKYNFKKEKLFLINNSIDLEKLDFYKDEPIEDVTFDNFTFINIARLTYQKGQDRLLKAYDMFYEKYPNSQLILLGEGDLKYDYLNLKNRLKSCNNIYFLGNKTNFYKYLYKSDCFILSSNFEGFPMILIESLCMGKTIISTYCETGPKELFDSANSFDDINNNILKTNYGYVTSLKNDSIKNLFIAMEQCYRNQNISYDTSEFRQKFSISYNIKNWDNIINNI